MTSTAEIADRLATVDMQRFHSVISANELLDKLGMEHWRIVDCRFDLMAPEQGYKDYLAGHIPGAVYASLDRDLSGPVLGNSGRHPLPDPEAFVRTLEAWGISNGSQVVAYDYGSGAIAARLWWMLRWLGHTAVAVLDGGIAAWTGAGGPVDRFESSRQKAHFKAKPAAAGVLELAELLHKQPGLTLVDARDRNRFQGLAEPIDKVAGHIPGARNLPYSELLTAEGRFLSAEVLRQRLLSVLGAGGTSPWAAMCGSGVTACHLALAAEIAGIPAPRLYVGSWSEWIRDPGRPVATGPDR
ncbi:MAG TPA: sulfurtransferase [Woeseiaceae bacterium]|nr:sulfurtransferase [Woeseiaceae bacterium]